MRAFLIHYARIDHYEFILSEFLLFEIQITKKADTFKMDPLEIYENLKEKIIWLDLKPGSALNLLELSKSYS